MMKPPKRPAAQQQKIEEFARRRAGATYLDAASAAQSRLHRLRDEYNKVPSPYRGYLAVGICSSLESHIKYSYAAAAERFSQHPDLLRQLFDGISVDIDALIATTTKTFHLADVVAASVTTSTLKTYLDRASHFFSVLMEKPHKFPWDYLKVLEAGDPELAKDVGFNFERLNSAFDARHKFVHETNILGGVDSPELSDDEVLGAVQDALFLIAQFQRKFEHLVIGPKFAIIREDESLDMAATRNEAEIDAVFARLKDDCHEMQLDSLERFKAASFEYLRARSDFYASIFLPQLRYEVAVSEFLDLAPEYRQALVDVEKRLKYARSQWPIERQHAEFGPTEDLG